MVELASGVNGTKHEIRCTSGPFDAFRIQAVLRNIQLLTRSCRAIILLRKKTSGSSYKETKNNCSIVDIFSSLLIELDDKVKKAIFICSCCFVFNNFKICSSNTIFLVTLLKNIFFP